MKTKEDYSTTERKQKKEEDHTKAVAFIIIRMKMHNEYMINTMKCVILQMYR